MDEGQITIQSQRRAAFIQLISLLISAIPRNKPRAHLKKIYRATQRKDKKSSEQWVAHQMDSLEELFQQHPELLALALLNMEMRFDDWIAEHLFRLIVRVSPVSKSPKLLWTTKSHKLSPFPTQVPAIRGSEAKSLGLAETGLADMSEYLNVPSLEFFLQCARGKKFNHKPDSLWPLPHEVRFRRRSLKAQELRQALKKAIKDFRDKWADDCVFTLEGDVRTTGGLMIASAHACAGPLLRKTEEQSYGLWLNRTKSSFLHLLRECSVLREDFHTLEWRPYTDCLEAYLAGLGLQAIFCTHDKSDKQLEGTDQSYLYLQPFKLILPCIRCGRWNIAKPTVLVCDDRNCRKKMAHLNDPYQAAFHNFNRRRRMRKQKPLTALEYRKWRERRGIPLDDEKKVFRLKLVKGAIVEPTTSIRSKRTHSA